jgi:hypothetical protein
MREVGHRESDAILGAMRQVALAGGHAITWADTTSVLAAARYLLRRRDLLDIGTLPAVAPQDLVSILHGKPELVQEAVKYLAIMAMVDGTLDHSKLARVLDYARALDVEADYLTDLVEAASGHLAWATADMLRKNVDSIISRPFEGLDPAKWIRSYEGANADPALVARYDALGKLPQNTFGKALWDFDKRNGYPFPGDPTALNAAFGTPHDSTHVISDYDTSARGELLVSTFTASMHPIHPMSGHILPVIFFFHFGEQLNDVGHAGKGGLDPDEFWHAWARGAEMTVDIFDPKWNVWDWVERDLEELRRAWNVTPAGPAR